MSRTATEGIALVNEENGKISIIEINSETDFVAKNKDFIDLCKELSKLNFLVNGNLEKLNNSKMQNGLLVKDNLINLISKIGEKITIRRADFFDNSDGVNFYYVHSALDKNIGKIISVIKLENIDKNNTQELGSKLAMHIAASNPLAIDKEGIDKTIVEKELEIIKAETLNSGKPPEMVEKISKGKLTKFLNENSLLNQAWIMDPKKTVQDVIKDYSKEKKIKIIDYVRYKVGEGV